MAFLAALRGSQKLKKTQTKERNFGEELANDKEYWRRRADCQKIADQLYLTSYIGASKLENIEKYGITHILVTAKFLKCRFPQKCQYKQLQILDSPDENILTHFLESFEWVDSAIAAGGNILIHCNGGVSRAASFMIGYVMYSQALPYARALEIVKEQRDLIEPNAGFIEQLQEFERSGFDAHKIWAAQRGKASAPVDDAAEGREERGTVKKSLAKISAEHNSTLSPSALDQLGLVMGTSVRAASTGHREGITFPSHGHAPAARRLSHDWQLEWPVRCLRLCCASPECGDIRCGTCTQSIVRPVPPRPRYICLDCVAPSPAQKDQKRGERSNFPFDLCGSCFAAADVVHVGPGGEAHGRWVEIDVLGHHRQVARAATADVERVSAAHLTLHPWEKREACPVCTEPFIAPEKGSNGDRRKACPPGCESVAHAWCVDCILDNLRHRGQAHILKGMALKAMRACVACQKAESRTL